MQFPLHRYRLDLLPPLPPTASDAAAPLRKLLIQGRRAVAAGFPASSIVNAAPMAVPPPAAGAATAAGIDIIPLCSVPLQHLLSSEVFTYYLILLDFSSLLLSTVSDASGVPPPANAASVADLSTPPPSAGPVIVKDDSAVSTAATKAAKSENKGLKSKSNKRGGKGDQSDTKDEDNDNGNSSQEELALKELGMAQLRDELLALGPLDSTWVRAVNAAEAQSWQRISGSLRIGRNVDLLQFDCGGQQWVSEVCYPTGTLDNPTGADMAYMEQVLLHVVHVQGARMLPCHCAPPNVRMFCTKIARGSVHALV